MAKDQRKRQKKLEQRAAKRKEKKHHLIRAQSAGLIGKLEAAASWPLLHCWVADVVWTEGIGSVLVSRVAPSGSVAVVSFLVDRYCLGVKNALSTLTSRSEYESKFVHGVRSQYPARDVSLAYACKFVEDAVAYAEQFGLHPHADYHDASLLFGDVDPSQCTEVFEFGQNGKPFFVAGPHDSPERCRRIIAALMEHCGPGRFDYVIPFGDPDKFLPQSAQRGHPRLEYDTEEEFDDEDE